MEWQYILCSIREKDSEIRYEQKRKKIRDSGSRGLALDLETKINQLYIMIF